MKRVGVWCLPFVLLLGCEVEPAQPSDSIETPWQFTIEFALEDYGEPGEYIARARLYDALDSLDPVGNAGKSLRLSEGDEIYVDGVHLDVETRTVFGNRESYDYSAAIVAEAPDYHFEFRRPDETISATVPRTPGLEVSEVGALEHTVGSTEIEWVPIADETWASSMHPMHDTQRRTDVNISMEVLTDDCLTVIGGERTIGLAGNTLLDSGSARVNLGNYHSLDHDCEYDIIVERSSVRSVSGTWTKDGVDIPTNGAWAIARDTRRTRFVALQRE